MKENFYLNANITKFVNMELKERVKIWYSENPNFNRSEKARQLKAEGDSRDVGAIRVMITRYVGSLKEHHQIEHPDKDGVLVSYSAINPETNALMDINEFCAHYGLSMEGLERYNLVGHTGTPFWHLRYKVVLSESEELSTDFLTSTIKKYIKPVKKAYFKSSKKYDLTALSISDVHVGMEIEKDSIYGGEWNEEKLMERAEIIVKRTIENQVSDNLHIRDYGDLLDGYDKTTVRKGHELPQNMNNKEQFDTGLKFKMYLIDNLVNHFNIEVYNICNDNHSGWFGYLVNSALKEICSVKYGIKVINFEKFINHYYWNNHCFGMSHGKDDKTLKFGFQPHMKETALTKLDGYCKQHSIYNQCEFIEFGFGDSHRRLTDFNSSDDFNLFFFGSVAPQSKWVQNNFKKGRSTFDLLHYKIDERNPLIDTYEF